MKSKKSKVLVGFDLNQAIPRKIYLTGVMVPKDLILVTYVVGSRLLFGCYIARKRRQGDPEAYFLGGRNIHWVFIGLSFYVSNMSSSTFVGLPSSGLMSKKPSDHQIASLTWSRNFWRSESEQLKPLPWYRDYRIQSVGLMAAAMLIVIAWW